VSEVSVLVDDAAVVVVDIVVVVEVSPARDVLLVDFFLDFHNLFALAAHQRIPHQDCIAAS